MVTGALCHKKYLPLIDLQYKNKFVCINKISLMIITTRQKKKNNFLCSENLLYFWLILWRKFIPRALQVLNITLVYWQFMFYKWLKSLTEAKVYRLLKEYYCSPTNCMLYRRNLMFIKHFHTQFNKLDKLQNSSIETFECCLCNRTI